MGSSISGCRRRHAGRSPGRQDWEPGRKGKSLLQDAGTSLQRSVQQSPRRSEPDSEPDAVEHCDAKQQQLDQSLCTVCSGHEDVNAWSLDDVSKKSAIGMAVLELKGFLLDWSKAQHDEFWHRKSHQRVLAVVVCRSADGGFTVYRGMNTEVSLPAGSLCAERAAIARAATDFQAADQLEAIAVLDPNDQINPLWPCEVCQSWLTKLRDRSPNINVIAMTSSACESFIVRVNGQLLRPPRPTLPPPRGMLGRVALAEGTEEWPWEARELVYVHGDWKRFTAEQRHILRCARAQGTHLLVGVHRDAALKEPPEEPDAEDDDFEACCDRLMDNRHVSSILRDAPLCLTEDMIRSLGIRHVMATPACKDQDAPADAGGGPAYRAARELGILAVVPKMA